MFAAIYKILPDRNLEWRDVGDRRRCNRGPFHDRQVIDRLVYRDERRGIVIRRRRRAPGHAAVGLLLVGDIPFGRRIDPRLFRQTRQPVRPGSAGRCAPTYRQKRRAIQPAFPKWCRKRRYSRRAPGVDLDERNADRAYDALSTAVKSAQSHIQQETVSSLGENL